MIKQQANAAQRNASVKIHVRTSNTKGYVTNWYDQQRCGGSLAAYCYSVVIHLLGSLFPNFHIFPTYILHTWLCMFVTGTMSILWLKDVKKYFFCDYDNQYLRERHPGQSVQQLCSNFLFHFWTQIYKSIQQNKKYIPNCFWLK